MTIRLHPFTPMALTAAVVALAVVLPAPEGPVALYGLTVAALLLAGATRAVGRATVLTLPIWFFLFLIHGVLREAGPAVTVAGIALDAGGVRLALAQGARLGAIIAASAALLAGFRAEALLDAVAARGGSLRAALLVTATLQAIPRLRRQASQVLEAQRVRGLRVGGSPVTRLRALGPLALPLVLTVLHESDDRAMSYAARGVGAHPVRTALFPPPVRLADRVLQSGALAAVLVAIAWRLLR